METQSPGVIDYVEKINKVESMLNEIKFFLLNKDFNESIKRGERDIKEGRVTVCQTEEELDNFFASV
ncbi:hypothetical protein KAJ87_04325 [Candidatus Pacearchaeota archaeon]|nr:hypothetical protein [Candidatus Pacearchaeota archaeon]